MFDDDDGRGRVRWRAMAAELGGVLHAPGRRQADDWIEVFVADVRVWVDSYVERPGNMRHEYTRVRARVARGPAPRLHIRRQHFLHAIAKVFGAQDIVVGDPAFDAKYVVKSDSLPLARRVCSPAFRRAFSELAYVWLDIEDDVVTLAGCDRWEDTARARAAIELVAALAAYDYHNTAALATLGEITARDGARPCVAIDVGARVEVAPEDHDDQLVMVARVDEPVDREPRTIEVTAGRTPDAAVLPQGAQQHLASVGTGTLVVGLRLAFRWHTVDVTPAELAAGAALLGAIAAQGGSVYR